MIKRTLAVLALTLSTMAVHAQQQCPEIPSQPSRQNVWANNLGPVYVYVMPTFSSTLAGAVNDAVNAWGNSSLATMMGLRLIPTTDPNVASVFIGHEYPPANNAWAEQWSPQTSAAGVHSGRMWINPQVNTYAAVAQTVSHAFGHPFGLQDCLSCASGSTTMNQSNTGYNDTTSGSVGPTGCDELYINSYWRDVFAPETDECTYWCMQGYATEDQPNCYCPRDPDKDDTCEYCSPIILDLKGDGIELSSAAEGVAFDLDADNRRQMLGWTRANSDDAWLVLDRNCNGEVDDGTELFGNFTAQPTSDQPHGYAALAVFDTREQGGNANGSIDANDAIFNRLRVWRDRNHDGRSDATELDALSAVHVVSIDLDYRTSNKHDANGNFFRYRSKVTSTGSVHHWSYDVFLDDGK